MRKSLALLMLTTLTAFACTPGLEREVDAYLKDYARRYQELYYAAAEAEWKSNTHIVEGDTTNAARTRRANEALANFVGSVDNIEKIRGYLEHKDELDPLAVRQLEVMLYNAADNPQTVPELVKRRIAAEAAQTETLFGFDFKVDGRSVTPNQIDDVLYHSSNLRERRKVWEASKEVGPRLKPGIVELRDLRNKTVQALGYPDFFSYQVSDYGMSTSEMLELTDKLVRQLRPLYRELHTWTRYELAKRYKTSVPDMIPAHWLPNRWAQDWSPIVTVSGFNADSALGTKTAEWIVKQGESFYTSLGFDPLPESFWRKSSLYPLEPDAGFKKNTHASAWHMNLADDVRSLMSVEPNQAWYETVHHELGHIYYYMSYSTPNVPLVLRAGANRAYHEGLGSMIGLAASQRRFMADRGLVPMDAAVDPIQIMLKEALNYVVFIPFSAGTMTRFEHALYAGDLSPDSLNETWWNLVRRYQGVVPPAPREEQFADALTKTHINNDPAQYYDYALSNALLFQLHDHIARDILHQDPHDTDYYGNTAVGDFLRDLMAPGASKPWREVLRRTTGRELDAQAMVDYFKPLYDWLVEQNRGRTHTLPDLE